MLQPVFSCKIALRKRSIEIESELTPVGGPQIWKNIDNRSKFFEEGLFKGLSGSEKGRARDRREPEYDLFIWGARILILLWIVVLFVVGAWGPTMRIAAVAQ